MSKVLTADEFLMKELEGLGISSSLIKNNKFKAIAILNKYAAIHVQATKDEIAKRFGEQLGDREGWGKELIDNCYPSTNIK